MKKKIFHYIVTDTSGQLGQLGERIKASFEAVKESEAKRKFKKWFPDGDGYLKYKLYKMIDTSAGKK